MILSCSLSVDDDNTNASGNICGGGALNDIEKHKLKKIFEKRNQMHLKQNKSSGRDDPGCVGCVITWILHGNV